MTDRVGATSVPAIDVVVRAAGIHLTWPSVETVTVNDTPMGVGSRHVAGAVSLSWPTVPG
jgi:hypothetical protein